ncbi:MAG: tyrosine-type recombinase/integrase [Lachnospiraceae bacterium]|nr:tyrosine-type recombinase/integrase [Lachnospiraceae bacterium]
MAYKNNLNYHDKVNKENIEKLRELLDSLPAFCKMFFRGTNDTISSRTKIAYAYDLRVFFEYMMKNNSLCQKYSIKELPMTILDDIKREDIEEYLEYLSLYRNSEDEEVFNEERGKSRKLASLRSFYNFYFKNELIETNPASLVPMPKLHEKEIIRLEPDEVVELLDQVEAGTNLTKKQLNYHSKTVIRDTAILTLLLGTGIRVSECVGLDINDIDFNNNRLKVRRKGGYEDVVYFGDEVYDALMQYKEERLHVIPLEGHEDAFFLSLQNRRITVRSVEILVKKYASNVTGVKKITPHKLRSTFGTNLYQETGDIYLVADVLGHKDVNTTRKHYAAMKDEHKRKAAKAVRLREE